LQTHKNESHLSFYLLRCQVFKDVHEFHNDSLIYEMHTVLHMNESHEHFIVKWLPMGLWPLKLINDNSTSILYDTLSRLLRWLSTTLERKFEWSIRYKLCLTLLSMKVWRKVKEGRWFKPSKYLAHYFLWKLIFLNLNIFGTILTASVKTFFILRIFLFYVEWN
jgi:hypothetical protein